jgi:hypothetical protein
VAAYRHAGNPENKRTPARKRVFTIGKTERPMRVKIDEAEEEKGGD